MFPDEINNAGQALKASIAKDCAEQQTAQGIAGGRNPYYRPHLRDVIGKENANQQHLQAHRDEAMRILNEHPEFEDMLRLRTLLIELGMGYML